MSQPYGKSSGKDKARVFKASLGFEQADWELLKQRILEALPYFEATLRNEDEYGKRYKCRVADNRSERKNSDGVNGVDT